MENVGGSGCCGPYMNASFVTAFILPSLAGCIASDLMSAILAKVFSEAPAKDPISPILRKICIYTYCANLIFSTTLL